MAPRPVKNHRALQHQYQRRQQHAGGDDEDDTPGHHLLTHPEQAGGVERQSQRQQAVAQAVADPQRGLGIDGVADISQRMHQQPATGEQQVVTAVAAPDQQQAERQNGCDQYNGGEQRGVWAIIVIHRVADCRLGCGLPHSLEGHCPRDPDRMGQNNSLQARRSSLQRQFFARPGNQMDHFQSQEVSRKPLRIKDLYRDDPPCKPFADCCIFADRRLPQPSLP